jgi:hypothetical protein
MAWILKVVPFPIHWKYINNFFILNSVQHFHYQQDQNLPTEEHYIHHLVEDADIGLLIVCMFPEQSHQFQEATTLQIDIMFKHISPRAEFEIASWCPKHQQSMYFDSKPVN